MSNIDKQALREKFEAWAEQAGALPWGILKKHRNQDGTYPGPHYTYMWHAWSACHDALLDELETKEEQRANWFQMAQKLGDDLDAAEKRIVGLETRKPYGYLRSSNGQIQISIGDERPPNRAGGYATPWFAIYTAPPAPVVHDDLLSMTASAIEDLLNHTDPSTSYYSGVWADVPGKLRAAMLQGGNDGTNGKPFTCGDVDATKSPPATQAASVLNISPKTGESLAGSTS